MKKKAKVIAVSLSRAQRELEARAFAAVGLLAMALLCALTLLSN